MHRPRILLVDDDPVLCELVCANLREDQYEVTMATDGATALELSTRVQPDLVLVDSTMPDFDAAELTHSLRSRPETRETPVIILCAFNGMSGTQQADAAGADDYVTKPFNHALLVSRIRRALDSR